MSVGDEVTSCPLCGGHEQMGRRAKLLYGVPVCKKCDATFAAHRQSAFIIDMLLWCILMFGTGIVTGIMMAIAGASQAAIQSISSILGYAYMPFFLMKDGLAGRSPGKALLGVQVLDATTGRPAGFIASLKRNLPTLIPFVPWLIAFELHKGNRTGDGWSNTKVIWSKYKDAAPFVIGVPASQSITSRSVTAPF
jgi:uncharacterized RDD family membrane protein YckC